MLKHGLFCLICLGLLKTPGQTSPGQATLTIDDFKTGTTANPIGGTGNLQKSQTGSMLGGTREVTLEIQSAEKQAASFQVMTGKPALIVNAGYGVTTTLGLGYKVPPAETDLTRYDRFPIDFDGLDQGMNLNIVIQGDTKVNDGHTGNK
jgi:hypothetical protein